MKLRFIALAGITTTLIGPSSFAAPSTGMAVRVTYTDCHNVGFHCDYTPSPQNTQLSPKRCGYKIYQKLLTFAPLFDKENQSKFNGKGYLNLKVSNIDGDTIGDISVSASEDGTGFKYLPMFNTDSSSNRGVPCNVEGTTSDCYHDKEKISPTLPKPEAENSDTNCRKFLDQINEDHLTKLVDGYFGTSKPKSTLEDQRMRSQKPERVINDGEQHNQFNSTNPNE
jgi:hypothetical protein